MPSVRQPGPTCVATKPWFDVNDGTLHVGKSPLPGPVLDVVKRVSGAFGYQLVERIDLDRCVFFEEYEKRKAPFGKLTGDVRAALGGLLDKILADDEINNLQWIAYMLATTIHECRSAANKWKCTWSPVSESGGAGMAYGALQKAVDWDGWPLGADGKRVAEAPGTKPGHKPKPSPTATPVMARYYGRGFVQITHQENYRAMDNALGLEGKLVVDPELALRSDIAYQIMSYGMRKGSFRGKRHRTLTEGYYGGHKLGDYITGVNKDYKNARNIINGGLDMADTIKGYADTFEAILQGARVENAQHLAPGRTI